MRAVVQRVSREKSVCRRATCGARLATGLMICLGGAVKKPQRCRHAGGENGNLRILRMTMQDEFVVGT